MKARSAETKGVAESVLRAAAKLKKRPLDPQALLSQEVVREFIEVGICPWCGAGPFGLIASHVVRTHGIGRKELRDRAGLFHSASITSPEVRAKNKERGRRRGYPEEARKGLAEWRASGPKRVESEASKSLRQGLAREVRKPGNSNLSSEQKLEAVERMRSARSASTHERDLHIKQLINETSTPLIEIAASLGVHPRTLRQAMKRLGINFDGRSRRDHAAERQARQAL